MFAIAWGTKSLSLDDLDWFLALVGTITTTIHCDSMVLSPMTRRVAMISFQFSL